jgi:plasmid stabilization system protein ParE
VKSFFYPEAAADLLGLYKFIAESSGPARALSYIGRIENTAPASNWRANVALDATTSARD